MLSSWLGRYSVFKEHSLDSDVVLATAANAGRRPSVDAGGLLFLLLFGRSSRTKNLVIVVYPPFSYPSG
jgi:hypothetical protein